MTRRKIPIEPIVVNRVKVTSVIIDPHYEDKHGEHINDELIIRLIKKLDNRIEVPEAKDDDGFSYFVTLIELEKKQYRLIWLLEEGEIYIGVINAYRDGRRR